MTLTHSLETCLAKIGLREKERKVYLACLELGPSPVRRIAQESGINRGTTYDILKSLQELGLVAYYHRDRHQYFVAEDPEKLTDTIDHKVQQLEKTKLELVDVIPELQSMVAGAVGKPVAKYYEGTRGIATILRDVLSSCSQGEKMYYVYSSSTIKQHLYDAYHGFSRDRIKAGVKVKTVSIGPGGETVGLDERKWLTKDESAPTYTLLYENKVAMISVDENGKPLGVIIEDKNLFQTQKMIFEFLWSQLPTQSK